MMTISTIIANYQVKQRLHFLIYLFQAVALRMRRRGRKIEYSVLFPLRCLFRLSNMQNCHMNYRKYEVHSVNRNI